MTRHHRGKKIEKRTVYFMGLGIILIAVVFGGFVMVSTPRETPVLEETPAVHISVPLPPILTSGDTGKILTYTLRTSRFADEGLTLIKVRVLGKETGETLMTLEGTTLTHALESGATKPAGIDPATSLPNLSGPEIPLTIHIPSGNLPLTITHQLTFTSKTKAVLPFVVTGGEVRVPPAREQMGT